MKIREISRTEIFFTGHFYYESLKKKDALESLLFSKLPIQDDVEIVDSGFEVCFFRDYAKAGLIERQSKALEKQTFDNVFVLSDYSLIIIEAKAHQKFSPFQIEELRKSKEIILNSKMFKVNNVYLMGLHSSRYSPKAKTTKIFDSCITWMELALIFGDEEGIFQRAENIYNK
jgi:hypothetical protein